MISRHETSNLNEPGITLNNIGTIKFLKNGNGEKNIANNFMGIFKEDKLPFEWSTNERIVNISGNDSDFSKSWIIIENKKKYQLWKSSDGSNQVQLFLNLKNNIMAQLSKKQMIDISIVVLLIIFALQNFAPVRLKFLFFGFDLPLVILIVLVFFVGFFTSILFKGKFGKPENKD